MKQFLEDLKNALEKLNVKTSAIEEILADHEEIIRAGIAEGYKVDDILEKLGTPDEIAKELSSSEQKNHEDQDDVDAYSVWKTFAVEDEALNIQVDLVNEKIVYTSTESNDIRVLAKNVDNLEGYNLTYKDNTLRLRAPQSIGISSIFSIFMNRRQNTVALRIEIPNAMKIAALKHKIINGDTLFEALHVDNITLNTINGDINISNCNFQTIDWHTVNGDITAKQVQSNQLKSSQVSGDVKIDEAVFNGNITVETVSGDVFIESSTCERCDLSTVSGDIKGNEFYPNEVALNSVSGDIVIRNNEKRDIVILHKKSLSGDIKITS